MNKVYLDALEGEQKLTAIEEQALQDAANVLRNAGLTAIIGKRPNDHA